MPTNLYTAGVRNAGSYIVSGRPFCATGSLNNSVATVSFPQVTKEFVVLNRDGSNAINVYFHTDSPASCQYSIAAGEQHTFSVKCKQVYIKCSSTATYTLYGSLTHIPKDRMYALTGSGITE